MAGFGIYSTAGTDPKQPVVKTQKNTISTQVTDMLRDRLQQITDTQDRSKHCAMLKSLREEIPHSIKVLSGPNENLRYNCVMYAFGLEEDQEYVDLVFACPEHVHGDTKFIQFLIHTGDLDEQEHPAPGLLAIYFHNEAVRHIACLISQTRAASKWGIGELYEHDIFEVPSSYGEVVRYFSSTERDTVISRFIEFAENQGVRFDANGS